MPYVHRLRRLVRGRYAVSRFYVRKQPARTGVLGIPRYYQLDTHSCGFLAALAVVQHFAPDTLADEVLRVVAPTPDGCGQRHLIRCLKRFGVTAVYRERLGPRTLRRLTFAGTPVIVTFWPDWPDWYPGDHWTVVRGLDRAGRRVFLTNWDWTDRNGSLTWQEFLDVWHPRGAGLICGPGPR